MNDDDGGTVDKVDNIAALLWMTRLQLVQIDAVTTPRYYVTLRGNTFKAHKYRSGFHTREPNYRLMILYGFTLWLHKIRFMAG